LYSSTGFLADLSAAGLGTIDSMIVSLAAIAGAFSLCSEAIALVL
jgi:K+ transporter